MRVGHFPKLFDSDELHQLVSHHQDPESLRTSLEDKLNDFKSHTKDLDTNYLYILATGNGIDKLQAAVNVMGNVIGNNKFPISKDTQKKAALYFKELRDNLTNLLSKDRSPEQSDIHKLAAELYVLRHAAQFLGSEDISNLLGSKEFLEQIDPSNSVGGVMYNPLKRLSNQIKTGELFKLSNAGLFLQLRDISRLENQLRQHLQQNPHLQNPLLDEALGSQNLFSKSQIRKGFSRRNKLMIPFLGIRDMGKKIRGNGPSRHDGPGILKARDKQHQRPDR